MRYKYRSKPLCLNTLKAAWGKTAVTFREEGLWSVFLTNESWLHTLMIMRTDVNAVAHASLSEKPKGSGKRSTKWLPSPPSSKCVTANANRCDGQNSCSSYKGAQREMSGDHLLAGTCNLRPDCISQQTWSVFVEQWLQDWPPLPCYQQK